MFQNQLHFIYFLSVFDVWWWSEIVFAIDLVFFVRPEERRVEDFMDSPRFWQLQLVGYRSQYFLDFKRPFSLRSSA